jgi:hypothetical protein
VAGLDVDHVAGAKQAAGDLFKAAVGLVALGDGLALGLAQRVGLGLAAALGHGLGKVGEQHREPQPERDLQVEAEAGAMMTVLSMSSAVVSTLPTSTTNITGFLTIPRGSSLRTESRAPGP